MNTTARQRHLILAIASLLAAIFTVTPAVAQVTLVEDINAGAGGTYIFRAGAFGDAIFFSAYDGVNGEELWHSDGIVNGTYPNGTYLVEDIWPLENNDDTGAYSSKPEGFIAVSTGMYFGASHREDPDDLPNHDYNLWFSTGAIGNATQISGLELALGSMSLAGAAVFGNSLMVSGWDETYGIELWKVSGTTASRLTDIEPGVGGSDPGFLTVVGSQLFFSATNTATSGIELWVTNGAIGGERLIDIVPGIGSSDPRNITAFGGKAYFSAYTVSDGSELWASDGNPDLSGTDMVSDINPTAGEGSEPMHLTAVGDQLFFTADDGSGRELWVTDGTTSQKLSGGYDLLWEAVAFDGRLFYVNQDSESGRELWVSDGTGPGTGLFVDIYPGTYGVGEDTFPNSSNVAELTVAGGFLFFNADDGTHGPSLWVSDGTTAGTFMVANLFDYWSEEGPKGLTATTDRLFFQTETEEFGREVHSLPTANVVSPPAAPAGEENGSTESTYTYSTTGGSVSLDGSAVQYRFNWGDGSDSGWLDVDVKSAEHTWNEADTYEVTVDARSVDTPSITSNHSAALSVLMSFTETVDVSVTSGPETGEIWVEYEFSLAGESDYGHDMEFQVDWGDETGTEWAPFNATEGETVFHDWDELGEWPITVTLRCAEHTNVTDSVQHWITIEEETLDTPTIEGPTTGWTDDSYNFTVTGGSSAGHDLQYIVFWDDGSDTGWLDFGTGQTTDEVSHTWTVAEPFTIEVGVRCAVHDSIEAWNSDHSIEITAPPNEELTEPDLQHDGGDWNGYPDVSYSFTLSASSNLDHDLEYRVDWDGDMEFSEWTAFSEGETSAQLVHTWNTAADWDINIDVRCIEHTDLSASGTWQMFVNTEVVSEKSLTGPTSGVAGADYDYTLTAHSASGHDMEYQIYWGHGDGPGEEDWFDINPATGSAALSHSWPVDGEDHNYQVDYGVRCTTHNEVQEWASIWVSIPGETITNHTFEGPGEGLVGVDYDFTVTGTSPDGHSLEYKFEWGDGFPTDWAALSAGTAVESYHWASPGEFTVKASVRCDTHNHVLSEKEQLVIITSDTPPGWIFGDDFEYGDLEDWSAAVGVAP